MGHFMAAITASARSIVNRSMSLRDVGRDRKVFDLIFDIPNESGRAGAVHYAMIEGQRKGNYFGGFVFVAVRNNFLMRGSNEQRRH